MRLVTVGLLAACAASLVWFAPSNLLARDGRARLQSAVPPVLIDAYVTDDANRAVTTLRPQDLQVTVDGQRRPVVSLRYVYRGPGADEAARLADPARDAPAAAERTRAVLLLVDENAIYPGQHKPVLAVVSRMIDELGASDQAAVATLPRAPAQLVLSGDARERQPVLARVVGRAVTEGDASARALPQPAPDADTTAGATTIDPEEQARLEGERLAARRARDRQEELRGGSGESGPPASSTQALGAIIDGLAGHPGPKTVVVFRQAEWVNEGPPNPARDTTSAVLASAARARVVVHLVVAGQRNRNRNVRDDEMAAIALGSGGTITAARNASDSKAFDAFRTALGGGYLVEVEGRDGDSGSRPHAVKIESARPKTTVRAPGLWVARQDPLPELATTTPASSAAASAANAPVAPTPGTPTASSAPPAVRAARRSNADDPQLAILLARLAEYMAAYVRDFGNVVAEEEYRQRLVRGSLNNTLRHLKSDLLLVSTNAEVGWTQYRDVFEVDGRLVRDREARVQKLFLENPAHAARLALEISNEGARYNVGSLFRNINTPTLPLEYLSPKRIGGLSFSRQGEDTIDGIRTIKLAFEEVGRPTLVQPDNTTDGAPAKGTYWVDPLNGRVVRTRILVTAGRAEMTTTVVYKPQPSLGLWVPSEMSEHYTTVAEEIEGEASYRNFRSFNVTTEMNIKK